MVKSEFPEVQLVKLEKNLGIAGWNEGFRVAKGDYVLVLDDDSYPDKNSIFKAVRVFYGDNYLGIVAFNIFNLRIHKSETETFAYKPRFFVGCGALIKKQLLDKVGHYNEQYFIYLHELDFSSRCYDAGYYIKYLKDLFVFHNQSLLSRGKKYEDPYFSEYRFKYYFISYSIFLIQRFYLIYAIKNLLKWFLNRAIVSVKYLFIKGFLTSVFYLIKNFNSILKGRNILTLNIQKFYEFGNIPFIDKDFLKKKYERKIYFSYLF